MAQVEQVQDISETWTRVQATIIGHDPQWQEPVIPVIADGAIVGTGTFHRWCAEAGVVVLYVWDRTDEEMIAEMEGDLEGDDFQRALEGELIPPGPAMEVRLPVDEHLEVLTELLENGGGTLAVLNPRDEGKPPVWAVMKLHGLGLRRIIGAALRLEKLGL